MPGAAAGTMATMPALHAIGRSSRRVLGLVLAGALVALTACGQPAEPDPVEPWPLAFEDPGLLGYVAVQLPEKTLRSLLEEAFGSAPRGLGGGPALLVPMDPTVLGGPLGVMLPLANVELFEASLVLMDGVDEMGSGRMRLTVPPETGLFVAMGMYDIFTAPPSALGVLDTMGPGLAQIMGGRGPRTIIVETRIEDDRVLIMPSFEALGAAARLPRLVPGLATMEAGEVVLSLDLERSGRAYHGPIEATRQRLLGSLHTASALAGGESGLSIDVEEIEAQLEALALGEIEAIQVTARLPGWIARGESIFARQDESSLSLRQQVRVRWVAGGVFAERMESWRPAPEFPGASFIARREGSWWPEGLVPVVLAAWMGVHERVAEFEALVGALGHELSGLQGLLVVLPRETWGVDPFHPGGAPGDSVLEALGGDIVFATVAAGHDIDWSRLGEVYAEIIGRLAGDLTLPPDEREVYGGRIVVGTDAVARFVSDGGDVVFSAGQRGRVAWLGLGEIANVPLAACEAVAEAAARDVAAGPALRWVAPAASGGGGVEFTVQGRELLLDLQIGAEEQP